MDLLKALRALLSQADSETPAMEDTAADLEAATPDTEPGGDETAIDGPDEADQPSEAGEGDTTADEAADDTEAETLPASEVSDAELRDALNKLGAENESLRTRIAELGGDAELGDADDDDPHTNADDDDVTDGGDDYDDDKAAADIDKQKQEIAALRGAN